MKLLALAALMMLAGCGGGSSPAPQTTPVASSGWAIRYSPNMPSNPQLSTGGFYFDFPAPPGSVHYVTKGAASIGAVLTAKFDITATGAPVFNYKLEPSNTCDSSAKVRLFFQRKGDDLSAVGDLQYYRWWSTKGYELAPGAGELVVAVTPDQWTSVYGKQDPVQFQAALDNVDNVGMTFGGGCFYGHGVNVTNGTARFTLHSFN